MTPLRISKSFMLGVCCCGCGTKIPVRNSRRRLGFFVYHHKQPVPKGTTGEKFHGWKGAPPIKTSFGYIIIWKPDHHFADKDGRVIEHRYVWEQHNNACLLHWADIHHINGIKDDNRIANLQAMMHWQHTTITHIKKYD